MRTSQAPVYSAADLSGLLALRAAHPEAMVIAGGTDVMVFIEVGAIDPPAFIDIWGCAELKGVTGSDHPGSDHPGGGLRIGALTTWSELIAASEGADIPAVLVECARTVGARQIQNRGTVGGNIVNASPAGDSLPLWLALDASFEVTSARGSRRVAASDFFLGYREVDLAPDELLTAVHLPAPNENDVMVYRKVGTRLAQAISKVVLGGRLRIEDGVVTQARVALGSVAATPVRCASVEAALVGRPVDPTAADRVADDITPIDDIRSTADYRMTVARNIIRSWLARA